MNPVHINIIEKCQEILIPYPTPCDQCDHSDQKATAATYSALIFMCYWGNLEGKQQKDDDSVSS